MQTEPPIPDSPTEEALPPEWLEALRSLPSEQAQPKRETDAAVMAEARKTLAAIRRRRIRIHFWPILAAAACIALAFTLLNRPDIPPHALAPPPAEDKYALILREVTAVFPEQVKAIITEGGELRITLADQPLADNKQAVVVELCENHKCTTVITYVGQTVEVGGHIVTVRADEKGAIVVDTPDARGSDEPTKETDSGLHIRTRRI